MRPIPLIPSHSAQTPIFAILNRHPKTLALIDLSRNSVYHFVYTRDMKTITLDDAGVREAQGAQTRER